MATINKDKIKKEAKEIIDDFSRELNKIEELEEAKVERENDRREEKENKEDDPDFRKRMLNNAPKSKNDYIKAEKGKW